MKECQPSQAAFLRSLLAKPGSVLRAAAETRVRGLLDPRPKTGAIGPDEWPVVWAARKGGCLLVGRRPREGGEGGVGEGDE